MVTSWTWSLGSCMSQSHQDKEDCRGSCFHAPTTRGKGMSRWGIRGRGGWLMVKGTRGNISFLLHGPLSRGNGGCREGESEKRKVDDKEEAG